MTKYKNTNYQIQLETLTPVSIGNGETLSPYTDFVFDEEDRDYIYLVDKQAIAQAIVDKDKAEGTQLMTAYVNGIRSAFDNNRSNFDLQQFMLDKVGLEAEDYSSQRVAHDGLNPRDRREVKCMLKDNAQPYISGSSLKGAIKAAVLYDWFSNEGEEESNQLMVGVMETYEACRNELKDFDDLARQRNLNWEGKKRLFRIKRAIQDKRQGQREVGTRQLERRFDNTFNRLLTNEYRLCDFPRDFSLLKVGDSALLDAKKTRLQLTKRLHYNKGIVTIPANLESIAPKSKTNFRLGIEARFSHKDLQYMNEVAAEKTPLLHLFEKINKFHLDNIDTELELLDTYNWYKEARPKEYAVFERYQNFLDDLYGKVEKAYENPKKGVAYLCLGFGKSFFYNSIGMLARDWEMPEDKGYDERLTPFQKYCKLFFLGRDGQRDFPMTRTVTRKGLPMGWMRLEVKK